MLQGLGCCSRAPTAALPTTGEEMPHHRFPCSHAPLLLPYTQPVATLNELVLSKYDAIRMSSSSSSSSSGDGGGSKQQLGFDPTALSKRDASHYTERVRDVLKYLGRRRPWLIHDPRMAWLAPLWCVSLGWVCCLGWVLLAWVG